jgi:uncharacterized membrane protein (DUF4010 family)
MGARAAKTADIRAAAAAAVLSTIATIIQMGLVLGVTCIPTLRMLAIPLIFAGVAAVLWRLPLWLRVSLEDRSDPQSGRAFSLPTALIFALTLSCVLVASAALREWFGEAGVILAAALAGLI